jgi:hypothetical protein
MLRRGNCNKAIHARDATEPLQIVAANNATHAKANQLALRTMWHICLDEIGKLLRENFITHLPSAWRKSRRENRPSLALQGMRHRLHFFGVVLKAMNKKNRIWMRLGVRGILRRQPACSRHTEDDKQTQENCSALNVDSQLHEWQTPRKLDFRAPAFTKVRYRI